MNFSNVRYTKGSSGGGKSARSSINYALHREADDGKSEARELLTRDGAIDKTELLDRFDNFHTQNTENGRETYYYSVVLNPGEGKNDVDKGLYASYAMNQLEDLHSERGSKMEWAAVVHDNQGNHDHVHVVMVTDKTMNKKELKELRERITPEAWQNAVESRDADKAVVADRSLEGKGFRERDLVREMEAER